MGWLGDELVVIDRGRLVVVALHVVVGDLEHGVVGQRAVRVVMAHVLEGLQPGPPGVDERLLAGEPRVPGELLFRLGLGIALREPHLGQRVLAADQLVPELGAGVVGVEPLEAVVGLDVLLLLVLALGHVILDVLAPVRSLSLLGDLGERRLGLGELPLLEELEGVVELLVGLGVGLGLEHGPPAVRAQDQRRSRLRRRDLRGESASARRRSPWG